MKTLNLLMLLATVFVFTSCTKFKDGKYIVVNIKSHDESYTTLPTCSDDTLNGKSIGGFLKEKFTKRPYLLKFKEDFVVLRDLEEGEDTILALGSDSLGDYYSTDVSKGEEKEQFHIQLRPSKSSNRLVLIVDLNVPWGIRYRPVQLGGKYTSGGACGRVICYLSKLD